jgi:hypothetical protein
MIGYEHGDTVRMVVHDRFFPRSVSDPHNTNSVVFEFRLVVLGIDDGRIATAGLSGIRSSK